MEHQHFYLQKVLELLEKIQSEQESDEQCASMAGERGEVCGNQGCVVKLEGEMNSYLQQE